MALSDKTKEHLKGVIKIGSLLKGWTTFWNAELLLKNIPITAADRPDLIGLAECSKDCEENHEEALQFITEVMASY